MKQKITYILTGATLLIAGIAAHFSYKSLKTARSAHADISEVYHLARTSLRAQERILKLTNELNEKNPNIDSLKERICQLQVEEGGDVGQTAAGYDGLAKIYGERGGKNNLFKAIDFASRAIELSYSKARANTIYKLLKLEDIHQTDNVIGNIKSEEELLRNLVKQELSANSVNSNKVFLYTARLSHIYKFGRASTKDAKKPPQFSKALEMRKHALKQIIDNEKNIVDIVFIIDDKFSQHAAATIGTILINAYPETYYNFHFLMDPQNAVTEENQLKLKSLASIKDCGFDFKMLPDNIIPPKFMKSNEKGFGKMIEGAIQWPRLIMLRLFLDKAYPHKERMLYLDVDIMVKRDLTDLFQKNIDGYKIAGALDLNAFKFKSSCQHKKLYNYINSGVLLFNLKEWRSGDMYNKIVQEMDCNKCKSYLYDQDIINRTAKEGIYELSTRWNHASRNPDPISFISHMYSTVKNIKKISVEKAWKQPKVEQLWLSNPEEIPDIFWDYWAALDITPWKVNHS